MGDDVVSVIPRALHMNIDARHIVLPTEPEIYFAQIVEDDSAKNRQDVIGYRCSVATSRYS